MSLSGSWIIAVKQSKGVCSKYLDISFKRFLVLLFCDDTVRIEVKMGYVRYPSALLVHVEIDMMEYILYMH